MENSNDIDRLRRRYYNLRDNVNVLISKVTVAKNDLKNACAIGQSFSINGEAADGGKIIARSRELDTIISNLKSIVRKIDDKINELTRNYEKALEAEV